MTFGNRLADPVLVIVAVGSKGDDRIGDPVKKCVNHRGIVDFLPGHLDGDDLAAIGIDDM